MAPISCWSAKYSDFPGKSIQSAAFRQYLLATQILLGANWGKWKIIRWKYRLVFYCYKLDRGEDEIWRRREVTVVLRRVL
ncbi:hypothetical protein RJ640_014485 [Escallonia rubra]|uniref:Uncharacterized protein n=1 Tax=Escallonia rubra TaxID=112253 RepID=A0AA88UB97_9ASTE|nr:hypothetical protein RJ640_014485 [Escallonia rubra]